MAVGAWALATGACATPRQVEHPIVPMAVFDLNCPKTQLAFTQIDEGTWGVTGCGRRSKYLRICHSTGGLYFSGEECRWIAN